MALPTKDNPKKRQFLAAYEETATIRGAAASTGIEAKSHYRWLEADPTYRVAFKRSQKRSLAALEEEARRRARDGVRRLKFHPKTGEPYIDPETGRPYEEHQYSDVLLMFLMKGIAPEKYRERQEMKHTGKMGIEHSEAVQVYLPDNGRMSRQPSTNGNGTANGNGHTKG